jgi:hypothetical protein
MRRIRFRSITRNSFSRYLLYATGEILLVVIGIIIALMLDDWHDRRVLEIEKKQYIKALINDYTLDSLMLADYIDRYIEIEHRFNKLNQRAYQPGANIDTIISIAQNDYIPESDFISFYNTTTLKTIESTGKIELFDSNLRVEILKHLQYQNLSIESQKNDAESINSKVDEYTNKYKIGSGSNTEGTYLHNISWKIENEREFVVLFTETIGINRLVAEFWINQYRSLLEETERMIELLREAEH